jgi:hypothetical protein
MSSPPQATSRNPSLPPCSILAEARLNDHHCPSCLSFTTACPPCLSPSVYIDTRLHPGPINAIADDACRLLHLSCHELLSTLTFWFCLPPAVSLDRMHPLIRDELTSDYDTVKTALRSGVVLSRTSKASHTWNMWLDFCTTHKIVPWFPNIADPIPYLQVSDIDIATEDLLPATGPFDLVQ